MKERYIFRVPICFLILIFLISFFSSQPLFAQENSEKKISQKIEWEAVDGAIGYRVVVYRGDFAVIDERVNETFFVFSLPPGKYLYEVSPLNKFGEPESSGGKRELIIKKLEPALFFLMEKPEAFIDEQEIFIKIKVKNATEKTKFYLQKYEEGLNRVEGRLVSIDGDIFTLGFKTELLWADRWDLVAENPPGVTARQTESIILKNREKLNFGAISKKTFLTGFVYENIEIKGSGFKEGLKVEIRKTGEKMEAGDVEVPDTSTIRFKLNFVNAKPGIYSIRIINPDGKRVTVRRIISLSYTEEDYWKEQLSGISITGGFIPLAVGTPLREVQFGSNNMGGEIQLDGDFSTDLPFLRWFGAGFRAGVVFDTLNTNPTFFTGMGIYFKTRWEIPFNFILKMNLGVSSNTYSSGPAVLGTVALDFNSVKAAVPRFVLQVQGTVIYNHHEPVNSIGFFASINFGYRF